MILTLGAYFLYNLMCGIVPCDPKFQKPEVLEVPKDQAVQTRNLEIRNVIPVVETTIGKVEGYIMKSTLGKEFFAFEGIPYGESTAGSGRWKPPVPKRPWRGIRQAKKPGSDCTQFSLLKLLRVYGSDTCLFLNLYSSELPVKSSSKKLNVIVFIHGGSFIFGSGSEYGPAYIMNQPDVLYVNFNYRLGPLGFLSTGDSAIPGNYGLKDQQLALKWIFENVERFGGNPNNISLWGNSAGGVSVNLHMISNVTRNYFTNAFSSSGTAFQHWGVQSKERLRELTIKLARRVGCSSNDSWELAHCLRRIDSNTLAATQLQILDWFPIPPVLFSPVVEPEHPDAFLTISPEEAYRTGAVAKKPYVFGMTKDEGQTVMLIILPLMKTFPLRVMWNQIAPYYLQYKDLVSDADEITRKVGNYYFKGKTPRQASLKAFSDMITDRYLSIGIVKGVQAHASTGAPTYMYQFSFSNGSHNLANAIGYKSSEFGAAHSEDMFYFFNDSTIHDGHRLDEVDHELSSFMINIMTNFARTGEPTYTTETNDAIKLWEPIKTPSQIKFLQFDKKIEMTSLKPSQIDRIKFWTNLKIPNLSLWSSIN